MLFQSRYTNGQVADANVTHWLQPLYEQVRHIQCDGFILFRFHTVSMRWVHFIRFSPFFLPFFQYGVQLVLGGHWHDYQRYPPIRNGSITPTSKGGVTYLITGGGGFVVFPRILLCVLV